MTDYQHPIHRMEAHYRTGGFPYPSLLNAGLDYLMAGTGRTDFAPALMRGTQAFLARFNRSNTKGDCITSICNKISAIRYDETAATWLAQRYEEGEEILKAQSGRPSTADPSLPPPDATAAPPLVSELSPEEQEEMLAAINQAKANLPKKFQGKNDGSAH